LAGPRFHRQILCLPEKKHRQIFLIKRHITPLIISLQKFHHLVAITTHGHSHDSKVAGNEDFHAIKEDSAQRQCSGATFFRADTEFQLASRLRFF
jgi:hypothetical protein